MKNPAPDRGSLCPPWAGLGEAAEYILISIGTTGIVVANLLINFEADIRSGFRSLIIPLKTGLQQITAKACIRHPSP